MLIVYALAILCFILFVLNFFYDPHAHFGAENIPGFYGFYGFIGFTGLILAAKTLRILIQRPENYYKEKAVDSDGAKLDHARHSGDRIRPSGHAPLRHIRSCRTGRARA